MPKMLCYGRVSTDMQSNGLDTQKQRLEACAALHSGGEVLYFFDEDVSGSRPWGTRPKGKQLFEMAFPGDVVVVTKCDRAFRNMQDAASTLADWIKRDVNFKILDMAVDTSTPAGRLFFHQMCAFGEFEREIISQRIRETNAFLKKAGKPYSRIRPFGWVRSKQGKGAVWMIHLGERRIAEQIEDLMQKGYGVVAIARKMARAGVTKPGKKVAGRRLYVDRGVFYRPIDCTRLLMAMRAGYPVRPKASWQVFVNGKMPPRD